MSSLLSLLRGKENQLKFRIDYPRSLIHETATILENLNDQQWDYIDTLVVGYFHDHPFEANVRFGYSLLDQALKRGKNLFVFDSNLRNTIIRAIPSTYTGKIYTPEINAKTYHQINQFRHLPKPKMPVVVVIGTTNRQGKFTTQIRIKNILEKQGYKISLLTTEPHGELLDGTFAFPYGFLSTVSLDRHLWQPCLKTVIKGISYYNEPHLILTGIQGGLLPTQNLSGGNESCSLDFLLGVQPDALVCIVNPQDSLEIIEDTIKLGKIYTGAEILFLGLTPWERNYTITAEKKYVNHRILDTELYEEKRTIIEKHFQKKVVDIMDERYDMEIVEIVENFFS
jgi:hypothetical protein